MASDFDRAKQDLVDALAELEMEVVQANASASRLESDQQLMELAGECTGGEAKALNLISGKEGGELSIKMQGVIAAAWEVRRQYLRRLERAIEAGEYPGRE